MCKEILKFERNMLHGESIHITQKKTVTGFKKHWHNYFEIMYYHHCKGVCILNGEEYPIDGDCLFLLTPKDFHEIVTENIVGSYSVNVSFDEQIVDKKLLHALSRGAIAINTPDDSLCLMIRRLQEIFASGSCYRERHLFHLFNGILIDILQSGSPVSAVPSDFPPIIRESISYMLANPQESIQLETFAQRFGINKTYFSRLFHEKTGISFKKYLTDLRIECAKQMLKEKDLSIIDVGFECGFRSPSQFNRSFKATVGVTPSAYRTKNTRPS